MLKRLANHWAVRLLLATSLPVWVLLLATATHGSPAAKAVINPAMGVLIVAVGLTVAGVHLWSRNMRAAFPSRTEDVAESEDATALQKILNLIGTTAFFASGYQAVLQFDVFSVQLDRAGVTATPWQTLLALCAVQLVAFTTDAAISLARQRS